MKRYGNAAPRDVSPQAVFEFAGAHERQFRSHCGVVGLKPSAGALPAPFGFSGAYGPPYGVTAPVGRTVADAGMTLEIMAGPDPRDQRSVALLDVPPRAKPRIAVSPRLGLNVAVDADVMAAFRAASDCSTANARPKTKTCSETRSLTRSSAGAM